MLSRIHSIPEGPYLNIPLAIRYTHEALRMDVDNLSQVLSTTMNALDRIMSLLVDKTHHWVPQGGNGKDSGAMLSTMVEVYRDAIALMPLVGGFSVNRHSQLRALRDLDRFGTDALVCALQSSDPNHAALGLELLEQTRGIVWSQALQLRDPQTKDVPAAIATELDNLLHAISLDVSGPAPPTITEDFVPDASHFGGLDPQLSTSHRDLRHQQSRRVQTLLREIRNIPGLERFMTGDTYEKLMLVAKDHPVIVLVETRDKQKHFALAITSPYKPFAIVPLQLSARLAELERIAQIARSGNGRDQSHSEDSLDSDNDWNQFPNESEEKDIAPIRGMQVKQRLSPMQKLLQILWQQVVNPIFEHLQLKARC
jgi:hypothetical protein